MEKTTYRLFGGVSLTRVGRAEKTICDRLEAKRGIMKLRELRLSIGGSKVDTETFNRAIRNLEGPETIRVYSEKVSSGQESKIVILLDHT